MIEPEAIIQTVLRHYADTQATTLFGSYGTDNAWPDSDVDIALLLPPKQARADRLLAMTPLCAELRCLLKKSVDLIDLREVSTVSRRRSSRPIGAFIPGMLTPRTSSRCWFVVLSEAQRRAGGDPGGGVA